MSIETETSSNQHDNPAMRTPQSDHPIKSEPPATIAIAPPLDDIVQLGDVLLGDEMTMMGGDVDESWASSATRPSNQTDGAGASASSTNGSFANAAFACPPAPLTRHASLPVSVMRSVGFFDSLPTTTVPSPTAVSTVAPPALARQRSLGYLMHPQQQQQYMHPSSGFQTVSYPITRPVMVSASLELSLSHQNNNNHNQMPLPLHPNTQKDAFSTATTVNLEPIAFNTSSDTKTLVDGFDLDPVAFSVFGNEPATSREASCSSSPSSSSSSSSSSPTNETSKAPAETTSKPSIAPEFQHIESAFESLDKLLPEMDQELFQPSELNALPAANAPRKVQALSPSNASLLTPRPSTFSSARGALPLLMSPNVKSMAPNGLLFAQVGSPQHQLNQLNQMTQMNQMMLALSPTTTSSNAGTPRSKTAATCKIAGCDRRVRSKGFCKTHGGGRKCSIPGCKKSSQNGEFCIGHGGGKKCKEVGCAKAAQSHGLCKAHGGGARCKFPNCTKSSQGGGLCRAHGGGKRCQAPGCPKGAQRGNFCATHGGFRNCKIEGCVRTDRGGGFCEVHRRGRLCKVDGCKKLSRNQGMCTMHIREVKQELTMDQSA